MPHWIAIVVSYDDDETVSSDNLLVVIKRWELRINFWPLFNFPFSRHQEKVSLPRHLNEEPQKLR